MDSLNYAANGGTRCPVCGSKHLTSGQAQFDAGIAWANTSCDDCHASWVDEYALTGYSNLEKEA